MMEALTFRGPRDLECSSRPIPKPGDDELLIRVKAAGICGTDVLVYEGRYGSIYPLVPGHEFAGVVERAGVAVDGFEAGDRVAAEASWNCGVCRECREGDGSQCASRVSLGRNRDGAFAEYVTVPARAAHRLPSHVQFQHAQALTTVACAIHAVRRGQTAIGDRVGIFGPGVAGLVLLEVALLTGALDVVMFGTRPHRLALARELGATATVNVRDDDWRQQANRLAGRAGFDVIFEASGSPLALAQSIDVVRRGGRVVVYSIYDGPVDGFPAHLFYDKEVTVLGARGGSGGYVPGLDLLAREQLRLDPLISHELPLREAGAGFAMLEHDRDTTARVVLMP